MTTLREHVDARKAGTELTSVEVSTFEDALKETYRRIGKDVWGNRMPEDDEFVAVLVDRLETNGGLTPDEYKRFRLLRSDVKRQLALRVGP